MDYNFWLLRVPLDTKARVETVARAERRHPADMARILLDDALDARGTIVINNINSEEMKKADAR
jgi:hypothetical protein